ncbi:MAG: hypothetical protein AMXMBFR84_00700 [Candidatus Hydrogenedentota bacterium]
MSLTYIIDGYNVMHRCRGLLSTADHSIETARNELVDRVVRYCAESMDHAVIVFDGRGPLSESARPEHFANVEIVYSPKHLNADTLIERRIYEATGRTNYVVVSGDKGIRDLCRGMGSLALTPDNFLTTLRNAFEQDRQVRQYAADQSKRNEVSDRLDAGSLQKLIELRKKLDR